MLKFMIVYMSVMSQPYCTGSHLKRIKHNPKRYVHELFSYHLMTSQCKKELSVRQIFLEIATKAGDLCVVARLTL